MVFTVKCLEGMILKNSKYTPTDLVPCAAKITPVLAFLFVSLSAFAGVNDSDMKMKCEGGSCPQSITVTGNRPIAEPPPQPNPGSAGGPSGTSEIGGGGDSSPEPVKPPDKDNSKANKSNSTCTPVVLATGEKWLDQPDFSSTGINALSFGRTYRATTRPYFTYMFGNLWQSTYDYARLESTLAGCDYDYDSGICFPRQAIVSDSSGAQWVYKPLYPGAWDYYANGVYSATDYLYFNNLSGWTLIQGRTTTSYSAGGFVTSIMTVDPKGPIRTINFTRMSGINESKVLSVSSGGQTIGFTWTGQRVTAVTDTAGGIWQYGYSSNGAHLTSVTPPGASSPNRVYYYEDTANLNLLTGVAVDGVRKGTFT